jgi:hypothetical protein
MCPEARLPPFLDQPDDIDSAKWQGHADHTAFQGTQLDRMVYYFLPFSIDLYVYGNAGRL